MKLLLKTLQLFSNKDFKTWLIDSSASGQCLPFQLHLFHRSPLPLYTSYSNHGQVLYMQFSYYYHNLSCPLHKLVPLFGVGYYSFIITQHPEHWPNLEQVLTICHGNPNYSAGTPALLHIRPPINHPCTYILSSAMVPEEKLHAAAMLALTPVFGM